MAEDALIDEAPDDRPFAAPPFIIVMVTRHDMGRLAVREIADTIDVADPLRPVRAIECDPVVGAIMRSEEHTSELQSLMRISYAVFCLKKKKHKKKHTTK